MKEQIHYMHKFMNLKRGDVTLFCLVYMTTIFPLLNTDRYIYIYIYMCVCVCVCVCVCLCVCVCVCVYSTQVHTKFF